VVSRDIRRILTDRAFYFGILLDDVSITHLTFSKLYEASIEAKQVAQQEAERAKFVVDKALQEKQSAIVRAQVCKEEEGGRGQRECERMLLTAVSESSSF
jgi:prohibitin 2